MPRTHAVYLWGASAGLGIANVAAFVSGAYVLSLTYFIGQITLAFLGIVENDFCQSFSSTRSSRGRG